MNTVNPTVVMTDMGKIGWSDPVKAKGMLDKIPLGRFSGTVLAEKTYHVLILL